MGWNKPRTANIAASRYGPPPGAKDTAQVLVGKRVTVTQLPIYLVTVTRQPSPTASQPQTASRLIPVSAAIQAAALPELSKAITRLNTTQMASRSCLNAWIVGHESIIVLFYTCLQC